MLTGCGLSDDKSVETFLRRVSRLNDSVQGWLFDPNQLAPTYTRSRDHAAVSVQRVLWHRRCAGSRWREFPSEGERARRGTSVRGRLPELYALPHAEQITRHICVEGWSAIGRWGGAPFSEFLKRVGADTTAKYVGFKCADDYYESIDMPTALHPQTLLAFTYDGATLPAKYGFPMKLRMPTKLGYKNPKHIMEIFVTNTFPGGYWVDQGYNWFGGS